MAHSRHSTKSALEEIRVETLKVQTGFSSSQPPLFEIYSLKDQRMDALQGMFSWTKLHPAFAYMDIGT